MCLVALLAMDRSESVTASDSDPTLKESEPDTKSTRTSYMKGTVGSVHDFSDETRRAGDACSACHIPHVQAVRTRRPVEDTSANDDKTTPQDAIDQDAINQDVEPAVELFRIQGQRQTFVPDRYTPGATSLICLGCHDGTVASSTIGSAHAMLAGVREGFSVPEGYAWRDHPIGVPYPRNDRAYRPESFVTAEGKVRLPEGRMECISCHDPHNSAGVDKMLVKSNRKSALCLTCHIK
jgi:predicted CXXCH cytochrome family protein